MNKRELQIIQTKKKLCDTFIDIYKRKDIDEITVSEITNRSGNSRGTFYLYYRSLDDLLKTIENDLLFKIKERTNKITNSFSKETDSALYTSLIFEFVKENEDYVLPLMCKDEHFVSKIKTTLIETVTKSVYTTNKVELEYLLEYHFSAITSVINFWYSKKANVTLNKLFEIIFDTSFKGSITKIRSIIKEND